MAGEKMPKWRIDLAPNRGYTAAMDQNQPPKPNIFQRILFGSSGQIQWGSIAMLVLVIFGGVALIMVMSAPPSEQASFWAPFFAVVVGAVVVLAALKYLLSPNK